MRRRRDPGGSAGTEYVVRGRMVLRVYTHERDGSGTPAHAFSFDRDGRMHGLEREWHDDGRLRYEARWRHGAQHGVSRQWNVNGRLLVRTRFVAGTGLDIYCGDRDRVTETREMREGHRHGFERWWWGASRVWSEGHFAVGLEHGIFREWNERGGLKRGFPRYFVQGERVDRRAYVRACESDPTLPRITSRDDRPNRKRPSAIAD